MPTSLSVARRRLREPGDREELDQARDAEARFVERLFIASNSALANGLGGPNPTLTTQALATRTAEKIMGKYFDGVTQAVIGRGL